MSNQHLNPTWYEISIGWGDEKSWFLVDRLPPQFELPTFQPSPPRQESVEVKTVNGSTSEITIQATFRHLPTLEDAMAVVLKQTHIDLSGEVKYHLTSRKDGLQSHLATRERERMSKCVPDPDLLKDGAP